MNFTASCDSLFGWAHDRTQEWRSPVCRNLGQPKTPLPGKIGLSCSTFKLCVKNQSNTLVVRCSDAVPNM
ncbi:hypothetical protein QUB60_23800 [Microcoleus sp. A2-C5]|uniref:hypothetical protein n=1 Tax=Microcoleaceae TaxID=1892252 RepID=UPI002237AF79|nr:hypothetical protein [Lyngbya sp. CCAP 1446/10]MCW6050013.1 hypothetical protein [Lyngbya sp. CCAP 1446/10]